LVHIWWLVLELLLLGLLEQHPLPLLLPLQLLLHEGTLRGAKVQLLQVQLLAI